MAKGGRMRSTQHEEKPVTRDEVREIILEEVPGIVQKTIARFWEQTMLPYMKATFATKDELKESFELYDIKMEKRFVEVNARFDNIHARLNVVETHLGRIDTRLIAIREDVHEIRQSTTSRLDAHTTQIRQIRGVSDVDQGEEYCTEKPEK